MGTRIVIKIFINFLLISSTYVVSSSDKGETERNNKLWSYEDTDEILKENYKYTFTESNKPIESNHTRLIIQPSSSRPSIGLLSNATSCDTNCNPDTSKPTTSYAEDDVNEIDTEASASLLEPSHRGRNQKESSNESKGNISSQKDKSKKPSVRHNDRAQLRKNVLKFLSIHRKKLSLPLLVHKNHKLAHNIASSENTGRGSSSDRKLPDLSEENSLNHFFHTQGLVNQQSMMPFNPAHQPILLGPQMSHMHLGFPVSPAPSYPFNLVNPAQFLNLRPPQIQMVQQPQSQLNLVTPSDQNVAQSMDHYQRIRFNNKNNQNEFPIYLPGGSQNSDQNSLFSNRSTQSPNPVTNAETPVTRPPDHQPVSQQTDPQESTNPQMNAASAAALLTEKARAILSQINLNAGSTINGKTSSLINNLFNNRAVPMGSASNTNINNPALSNMIKSAAESWAASATGADTNPAIIVEHEGPSITTVDFGNNLPLPPPRLNNQRQPQSPEEEEVSAFYSEEGEENETEGSKRVERLRQSHQHPFEHQVDAQNVQTRLPMEPFFEGMQDHFLMHKKSQVRHPEPTSDLIHNYLHRQQLVDRTNSYPDSINAIKQREINQPMHDQKDFVSLVRNKLMNSSDEQIEKLIKELQDLNRKKKRRNSNREKKSTDDEDDNSNSDDDDDESEQMKTLKKKLMSKLKSKANDNSEHSKKESESKSFTSEAIKIPLHALLLAALDRRMSPSEKGPSVSPELVTNEGTRQVMEAPDNDYNDMTHDLNPLYGSRSSYTVPFTPNPTENINSTTRLEGFHSHHQNSSEPRLLEYIHTDYTIPKKYNIHELTENPVAVEPKSTDGVKYNRIQMEHNMNPETEPTTLATTRTPIITRPYRGYRTANIARSDSMEDNGAKSDHTDEGDFDVNKQIENFSQDRSDPALKPPWMSRKRKMKRADRRNHDAPIEFDDDYEESSRTKQRTVLKRRRPSPSYGDKGDGNFLNMLEKETTGEPDVDKNISDIKDGSTPSKEEKDDGDRRAHHTNQDHDFGDSERQSDEDDQDNENRQIRTREPAESQTTSSTWRPHMVDDEVRRIEEAAAAPSHPSEGRARINDNENTDYETNDERKETDSNQRNEDAAETRNYATTVDPNYLLKPPIEPNDNSLLSVPLFDALHRRYRLLQ